MEKVYTINMGKVWRKPRGKRHKASIDLVREYIKRHLKASEVKVGAELNHLIFSELPRKIKVKAKKEGEIALVTLSTAKFEEKKPPKKVEEKKEEKKEEKEEEKTPEELEQEKKEKEAREIQEKAVVLEG